MCLKLEKYVNLLRTTVPWQKLTERRRTSKGKKDDATMNLRIGSQVKHKLVVFGLNNNDESCLCWGKSIIIKLTQVFLYEIDAEKKRETRNELSAEALCLFKGLCSYLHSR